MGTKQKSDLPPRLNKSDIAAAKKLFVDELTNGVLGRFPESNGNDYTRAINSFNAACCDAVRRMAKAL